MERLSWVFELFDRMSGPAGRISKSLKRIGIEEVKLSKGFARMGRDMLGPTLGGFLKLSDGAASTVGVLGMVGGMAASAAVAVGAVGLAATVAGGAFLAFGTKQLAARESTLKSFELMTGSAAAAQDFYKKAVGFATVTPFGTTEVVDQFKRLMSAGFTTQEVPIVFQAVGDVAAMNAFSTDVMDRITRAFGQIKGRGTLQTEELYQVLEGANGAISKTKVFEKIAQRLKIGTNAVDEAISGRRVSADVGILAILEAIKEGASGGELGKGMLMQADTLSGIWATLSSIPTDLFANFSFNGSPGFDALKGFAINLRQLFDFSGERGKALVAFVEGTFNQAMTALFGNLSGGDAFKRMAEGFDSALKWMEALRAGFGAFWSVVSPIIGAFKPMFAAFMEGGDSAQTLKEDLMGLGWVLGGLTRIMLELVFLPLRIANAFHWLKDAVVDAFTAIGEAMNAGWVQGMIATLGGPVGMGAVLAKNVYDAAADENEVHSPSRKFARLGQWTAQGYAEGLEEGAPGALRATSNMLGTESGGGGRGGAGGGLPSVVVHIDARGNSNAEGSARTIEHMMPSAIARAFEHLAMSGGGGEPEPA